MAQRVQVRYIDDLDKVSPATQVLVFGWQGSEYLIDLSDDHAADFRRRMQGYILVAREVKD